MAAQQKLYLSGRLPLDSLSSAHNSYHLSLLFVRFIRYATISDILRLRSPGGLTFPSLPTRVPESKYRDLRIRVAWQLDYLSKKAKNNR